MKKIWIPIVIFTMIIGGGIIYNNFVNSKTDHMIMLSDKAYEAFVSGENSKKYLKEINSELESISGLLCAFLDRDIINDAKDSIVCSIGLAEANDEECGTGIMMMKEKISHIKNTAQIKLKYIL